MMHREDLIAKLVGKTMGNYGRYDFTIDAKNMEILSIDVVLDYFSCFAQLLPDPRELAVLFGQALIHDEFYIGDVPETPVHCDRSTREDAVAVATVDINDDANVSTVQASARSTAVVVNKMQLDHILGDNTEKPETQELRRGNTY